jgi:hypothetical protein
VTRADYAPGVCNIGKEEVAYRNRLGWWGLALTIALFLIVEFLPIPPLWCLVLFVPSSSAAAGFIQAAVQFCAAFGLRGVMNFSPELGHTERVLREEFRVRDRMKALQILGCSCLAGVCVTLGAWILKQAWS